MMFLSPVGRLATPCRLSLFSGVIPMRLTVLLPVAFLAGCSGAPDPVTASKPVPAPAAVRKPVENQSHRATESDTTALFPEATPIGVGSRREQRFDEQVGGLRVKGRQSVEAGPGGVRANQSVDVLVP